MSNVMVHLLFTEAKRGEDGLRPRISVPIEQLGITTKQALEAFLEMSHKGCGKFVGWLTGGVKEDGE